MKIEKERISKVEQFLADDLGYSSQKNLYFEASKHGVDFSISRNGKLAILVLVVENIEAQNEFWDRLNEIFHKTYARFAIVTNGERFDFFTDLIEYHQLHKAPILSYEPNSNFNKNPRFLNSFKRENLKGENLCFGPNCDYDAKKANSPTGKSWRKLEEDRVAWRIEALRLKGVKEITEVMLASKNIPSYEQYFSIKPTKNTRT